VRTVRHGNLEVALLGYDRDGKPLHWMVPMMRLAVPADRYAGVQARGSPSVWRSMYLRSVFIFGVYLRSGIYDRHLRSRIEHGGDAGDSAGGGGRPG
jgi:hypothetical protein